ncbi:glycosyltransferase [Flavobacterium sp. NST-5]|uniref:Glycosyltransferase n=1 Tax=Flavobacterium ichthyis TaxID=2698827 RepID=A0ABW9Z8F1_9FLAO|nr:glycosyltransferase family 4 protein [Flavobacterium ichthyis]NBL64852.1 glycosyltransferase [Flavobacterium ichthyis]
MKNLLYIGNKLSAHGFSPTTVETLAPLLGSEGFSVRSVSSQKNKILRFAEMLFSICKFRKTIDFVLIDTYSTTNFWYAFYSAKLCILLKIKYIPILHGGNLPNRLKTNSKQCKILFGKAYKIVAPSGYLFSVFYEKFPHTVAIPNTVSVENYEFKKREVFKPKLLWVRSFASIYNPKMAIEVLSLLQKKYPEASLCMVGPEKDGSLKAAKLYAQKLGIQVKFTGKLTQKQWAKLAEEYDFFINTTHYDNLPVSLIESMLLGLPIISTNVGGIPYLIENGKTGLLVADNDVDNLVKKLSLLIEDQDLAVNIATNAKIKANDFSWENVKQKWMKILT